MGVHGLWNLLEPVGKPVPLESLENKVLAVDVSIWLHQATKGFRDAEGNPLPNAHLIGLCHRLCKLLFYKIKPVFVFDGGVPLLKRQTMASRQSRREIATEKNSKLAEKILSNYLKSGIVNKKLGKKDSQGTMKIPTRKRETDLFELPPLPVNNPLQQTGSLESDSDSSDEDESYADAESISTHMKGHNIHSVDVTSDAFRALPANIQHEILLELKDTRKQSSWNRLHQMPKEARDFSGFQMERLLKRRNLQLRLDEVVKEIGKNSDPELVLSSGEVVQSQRMVSDSSTRYVLIKKALEKSPVKKTPPELAQKQIEIVTIENEVNNEDLFALEEDGLTQQELLTIMESQKQTNCNKSTSSSSEDDLDLEEVPQPAPLSLHVNPDKSYSSEEDIFADVFSSTSALRENVILNQDLGFKEIVNADMSYTKASISSHVSAGSIASVGIKHSSERSQVPLKESEQESGPAASFSSKFDASQMSSGSDDSDLVEVSLHEETVQPKSVEEVLSDIEEIQIEDNAKSEKEVSLHKKPNLDKSQTESIQQEVFQIRTAVSHEESDPPIEIWDDSDSDVSVRVEQSSAAFAITEENRAGMSSQRKEELEELGRHISAEQEILIQQHGKQERLAASITDQMYAESQELLRLFGIPYLVAPMEAEAQCAFLDSAGLTQGTITDDSDIWLFGGRRVYKNFFNQGKFVEFFEEEDIYQVFKMKRDKLIHLALLTGSDYTEGIQGVGPVCALEILAEFPYEGIEALESFRDWLVSVQSKKNAPPENAVRQKLRNLQIKPGFPNRAVVDAYIKPEVNQSRSKFSWVEPDLDALRDYLEEKIGWNRKKFDAVVVPVLQKFASKEYQTRIDSYFSFKFPSKTAVQISKRVMNAIYKADFGNQDAEYGPDEESPFVHRQPTGKKRKVEEIKSGKRSKVAENSNSPIASTSKSIIAAAAAAKMDIIWQREQDKRILEANKLKAVEIFKKSKKGRGKRLVRKPLALPKEAQLSESDSSS